MKRKKLELQIAEKSDQVTVVTVFGVEIENQEEVIQILKETTEEFFSKQSGYIGSSPPLHKLPARHFRQRYALASASPWEQPSARFRAT